MLGPGSRMSCTVLQRMPPPADTLCAPTFPPDEFKFVEVGDIGVVFLILWDFAFFVKREIMEL